MFKYLKLSLNYILPKKLLTKFAGYIANKDSGWFTTMLIDIFIWIYKVNMVEVSQPNITSYHTFNDFFIRLLKEDARPIDNNSSVISIPADGTISQLGCIKGDQIFQAKGHYYSLQSLLANDAHLAVQFLNGKFITIYLSPRDYHRVHMPCNGILSEMIYVPGKLYSLNSFNIHNVPNLFARNERLICVFNTDYGLMVQILIGAIIVSSIETVWAGAIKWQHDGRIKRWKYPNYNHPIILFKGQEMGHFKLGSTVINLFIPNRIKLIESLKTKSKTRVGQPLAIAISK